VESAQLAHPANKVAGWAHSAGRFLVAVRDELRKVTWPTRPELVKATRMIVVLSVVLGVLIGLMDWLLQGILVHGIARLAR
jgi:preprotein translocase SecE subunit